MRFNGLHIMSIFRIIQFLRKLWAILNSALSRYIRFAKKQIIVKYRITIDQVILRFFFLGYCDSKFDVWSHLLVVIILYYHFDSHTGITHSRQKYTFHFSTIQPILVFTKWKKQILDNIEKLLFIIDNYDLLFENVFSFLLLC